MKSRINILMYINLRSSISLVFVCTALFFNALGQDALSKQIRSGLSLSFGKNIASTSNPAFIVDNSSNVSMGYLCHFTVKRNLAISTGLDVAYSSIRFTNNPRDQFDLAYYINVQEIYNLSSGKYQVFIGEELSDDIVNYSYALLNSRNQYSIALQLPVNLQFMSDFVGFRRFYGQIGLRNNFRLFNRSKDNVYLGTVDYPSTTELFSKVSMRTRNLRFANMNATIGGGIEWNYSGSNSILIGAEYSLNLTSIYKKSSDKGHLYEVPYEYYIANSTTFPLTLDEHGNFPDNIDQIVKSNINVHEFNLRIGLFF